MNGPFYREEAKRYYRNRENIEKKWLDRFGSVSRDNDYQRNRECLAEVFNMLDIVMDICIEDFRKTHRIVAIEIEGKTPVYTFALADEESRTNGGYGEEETVSFSMPGNFARRVKVLRDRMYVRRIVFLVAQVHDDGDSIEMTNGRHRMFTFPFHFHYMGYNP